MRHGIYEEYWDHGGPKNLGEYYRGERIGYWEFYNFENKLREEGSYTDGQQTGPWKEYHHNGNLAAELNYTNGDFDGEQVHYDSTGQVVKRERYAAGMLIEESGRAFAYGAEDGDEPSGQAFKVVEQMPLFAGCPERLDYSKRKLCADRKFMKFIYSTIRYPADARARGVTGSAVVSFVVEADGTVTSTRVLSGLNQSITAELERIVSLIPVWTPGRQDGEAVRVQFNLPVKFQ